MKRQSCCGTIILYDMYQEFVTSRKYKSILERHKILENWKKIYRLEGRIYYINIIPELKTDLW
jgi:hypothetical protein